MNPTEYEYDLDTCEAHIAPIGMEHQERRKNGKGRWYATIPMRHFIIVELQKAFPELVEKMKDPSQATRVLSAFLSMFPLEASNKLTPEIKHKILKTYKLL